MKGGKGKEKEKRKIIIMITIVGNSLVVISVFSYRPLKKVQNYFLVSLAASDLCVATFVMPLHK
ncbi:unnamed protein product [Brugia pahangi]|uniref:G_PROTEIN_RECEP_F1_2 domain-containing protein n=1 Tax=Brugia pahangi TaxID=6280 RepID=A0A0N4TRJ5_BRUPA|nr:unnamed protein product [Brugia pahangi]